MKDTDPFRPVGIAEFIGQKKLVNRILISVESALRRADRMDHLLLTGPPGFGKTSLSSIIADLLGVELVDLTLPVDQRALTTTISRHRGVLLLDEIHLAPKAQQNSLLTLLQEGYLTDNKGRRTYNRGVTIIGATTNPEKIIEPLFDRFMLKPMFEPYSVDELGHIVDGMAQKAGVKLCRQVANALGQAAGGTPRNAGSLVLGARDLRIGTKPADAAKILDFCGVEHDGLTDRHMAYLRALEQLGGTAGLRPLSAMLRLNSDFVMELERLLIDMDLIRYGDRGRELTPDGFRRATAGPYTHKPKVKGTL